MQARTNIPGPDLNQLPEVIRRIVEVAQPERIILFGSAARGACGPNSDLDLLVIKGGRFDRGKLIEELYLRMYGVGVPVDLIVVTPQEVERYRDTHALIIKPALRDGREVYRA